MKKLEVVTAATETPRGERSHAVGAHVAEGHGGWGLHWLPAGEMVAKQHKEHQAVVVALAMVAFSATAEKRH